MTIQSTPRRLARKLGALLLAACQLGAQAAQAAPTLPQVAAGQATFAQQGNVFSITNTPGAIINWQSFNVGAGEITRFIQQGSDSAVLNRVLGQDPSRILGALQSNGKVFLINPNGIVFGQGARVDVAGLVASTLDIADADFLAGKRRFQAGAQAGGVRNEGSIATPSGGQVYLIAPDIENKGIISAPDGAVILAAAHSVQLVDANDPDLHVVLSAPGDQAINLGQVIARGGRIGIYGALVGQRGLVSADSAVRGANGKIMLKASAATVLGAGSVTSAAGSGGADGGEIRLLGRQVHLEGDALVDADGASGGAVLAGGDWQGAGATPRAQRTTLAAGATIRADASGANGDGGRIVLWSDGATTARGAISARGNGAGHGGKVETSGHDLSIDGLRVDARGGARGANGTWLLDPYDIEVVAGGTAGAGDVASPGAGVGDGVTRIAPATLAASGADVVLQARHDLTISSALDARGSVRAEAGNDIAVNAAVTSRTGDLDFRAGHAFRLGANGALRANDYIDIRADRMVLAGAIGTAGAQAPVLALTSADPYRAIVVGSGTADESSLWLDAAGLGRLSGGLYEINLGNSRHMGQLRIDAALTASSSLVLDNAGSIFLGAAVDLTSGPGSRFIANMVGNQEHLIDVSAPLKASASVLLQADRLRIDDTVAAVDGSVTLRPQGAQTPIGIGGDGAGVGFTIGAEALKRIRGNELVIGGLQGASGDLTIVGAADLSGTIGVPGRIVLDAGAGALHADSLLAAPGLLVLSSTGAIAQGSGGFLVAGDMAVRGGAVSLASRDNAFGRIAIASAGPVTVNGRNALAVGSVDGIDGVKAANGAVAIGVSGNLALDADVAGASVALSGAGINGAGKVRAPTVSLRSSAGIGSADAPLHTQASTLSAFNQGAGARPINIANEGALVLQRAVQDGAVNDGAIMVDSVGGLTVPAYVAADGGASGDVRTGRGDINLSAHSPLTIAGRVTTDSGNVRLEAGNDGLLTIAPGALVQSHSGDVRLLAGTTRIAEGSISVASPDKLHLPNPTLATCIATPATSGCTEVLAQAVQACVADPGQSFCAAVLPTLAQCVTDPGRAGCQAVLPTLAQCVTDPGRAGCQAVLPTLAQCVTDPSRAGCQAVLPTLAQCVTDPGRTGCQAVLPTLAQCVTDPGRAGCRAVLPTLAQCVTEPSRAGCQAVLPTLAQCVTDPSRAGCQAVLPTLAQCVADPGRAGCQAVLPTLAQCVTDPSRAGCQVVLPTLAQCVTDPSRAGCQAVLPTLAQCVTDPGRAGCQAVLPTLAQCVTDPGRTGCQAVLPTLAQCVTDPGRAGCQAVLPTLAQCVTDPSRAGCQAVLPTLAQCVIDPSRAGCQAVLPTLAQCVTDPSRTGCQAVLPTLAQCVTDPSRAGCQAILPTLAQCVTDPTRAGCQAVLPTLAQCATDPTRAGCQSVLPTLAQCATDPTRAGCQAVLPTLAQCVTDPGRAGCQSVLPTLAQCTTDPTRAGCQAILPTLAQCATDPTRAGCQAILPTLAQCVTDPARAGCRSVLPTIAQCAANPAGAGCTAVLPTLSQCVADSGRAGCVAVLPTLDQCIGSPSLQGCAVRLPTLAQCAQAPATTGCAAVLPNAAFCSTHPGDASCVIFGGGQQAGGAPVAQALQSTVQLVNAATPAVPGASGSQEGTVPGKDAATAGEQAQSTGVKNDKPAIKNYCN